MESSKLEQENASLKEELENEIFSVNYKKQCNDVENDNLILLQQKGITLKLNKPLKGSLIRYNKNLF